MLVPSSFIIYLVLFRSEHHLDHLSRSVEEADTCIMSCFLSSEDVSLATVVAAPAVVARVLRGSCLFSTATTSTRGPSWTRYFSNCQLVNKIPCLLKSAHSHFHSQFFIPTSSSSLHHHSCSAPLLLHAQHRSWSVPQPPLLQRSNLASLLPSLSPTAVTQQSLTSMSLTLSHEHFVSWLTHRLSSMSGILSTTNRPPIHVVIRA